MIDARELPEAERARRYREQCQRDREHVERLIAWHRALKQFNQAESLKRILQRAT